MTWQPVTDLNFKGKQNPLATLNIIDYFYHTKANKRDLFTTHLIFTFQRTRFFLSIKFPFDRGQNFFDFEILERYSEKIVYLVASMAAK